MLGGAFSVRTCADLRQRYPHVGLTSAHPHLAERDIRQLERVYVPADKAEFARPERYARRLGVDLYLPFALRVDSGSELQKMDFGAGLAPPPEGHRRRLALQHPVARDSRCWLAAATVCIRRATNILRRGLAVAQCVWQLAQLHTCGVAVAACRRGSHVRGEGGGEVEARAALRPGREGQHRQECEHGHCWHSSVLSLTPVAGSLAAHHAALRICCTKFAAWWQPERAPRMHHCITCIRNTLPFLKKSLTY